MRAAVFVKAGEPWAVHQLPNPEPLAGEAVIKVGRCGICGTDLSWTSGHGYDFAPGTVMGHEFCGEVVAVGKGVETLRVGDVVTALPAVGCGDCPACRIGQPMLCAGRTFYLGGMSEYMRIGASASLKLPAALSLADGALVEPLAVGLHGVRMANLQPGARVLVLGAGSVGLTTAFWARRFQPSRVVVSSRSLRRRDFALSIGADSFLQSGEGLSERIVEELGGEPDVVFECIGVPGALEQAIAHVAPNGTVVSLGFCMTPDPIVPGLASLKQARLLFSMAYTLEEFQHVIDVVEAGHVEPRTMVTSVIGLDEVPGKVEAMREQSEDIKVHVDPWRAPAA